MPLCEALNDKQGFDTVENKDKHKIRPEVERHSELKVHHSQHPANNTSMSA